MPENITTRNIPRSIPQKRILKRIQKKNVYKVVVKNLVRDIELPWELRAFNSIDAVFKKAAPGILVFTIFYLVGQIIRLLIK